MKVNGGVLKMDKSSKTISSTTLKNNSAQSEKLVPPTYPDSVRMTAERLANAVIRITRQGGPNEH